MQSALLYDDNDENDSLEVEAVKLKSVPPSWSN